MSTSTQSTTLAVIGGGPAGLMAALTAAEQGVAVALYEGKPSVGRKFLIAGRGGLNLTHNEAADRFAQRFGLQQAWVSPWLSQFSADHARAFAAELGIATFVGTSGRVFPDDMKAAPMLRAWVQRLRSRGVLMHMRHRLSALESDGQGGWSLRFQHDSESVQVATRAVVLALGGASWPQLGSDGSFASWLSPYATVADFKPANCGFELAWSEGFRRRKAGAPLKSIALIPPVGADHLVEAQPSAKGECVISEYGLEGSLIYAHARWIRDRLESGPAAIELDLLPDLATDRVLREWSQQPAKRSLSERLRRMPGLDALKVDLCLEAHKQFKLPATAFPHALKALPLPFDRPRPIAEAISTAGGVVQSSLDETLMLRQAPGVFCAGEMLDWEAPTGGYLLTASMASGVVAAQGATRWLQREDGAAT
ncbi:aminoacetone oxidase family FAD-binding enzyme [Ahniella affigens]|uniref:Aminoacetone oxidase family FAD-binding enzyme n=1 Tax=Ahniella affigens TaxID=2021234 RepID=A0A2P1PV56_9GAMM|nr:TIGR03862 family flavoprotein [Ahniella affigens]AVP98664.1 aminoacetone oxidase family FAD-binding enzyme [Ahniella affigens]